MNKDEALEILRSLSDLFPAYSLTKAKAKNLLPVFEKMDYERVKQNLYAYALEHTYPPTIADIAAFPPDKDDYMDKIKEWQKEAAKVTPEQKAAFLEQFQRLVKEKSQS